MGNNVAERARKRQPQSEPLDEAVSIQMPLLWHLFVIVRTISTKAEELIASSGVACAIELQTIKLHANNLSRMISSVIKLLHLILKFVDQLNVEADASRHISLFKMMLSARFSNETL